MAANSNLDTTAVTDLLDGDLVHVGGDSYVLVARVERTVSRVAVTIYDGDRPDATYLHDPADHVHVTARGLSPTTTEDR